MTIEVHPIELTEISALRNLYRREMNCQIIHDSIHSRDGWTKEYQLRSAGQVIGYASVAVKGPWADTPTLYEFYLQPKYRTRTFEYFEALMSACEAQAIETQTNGTMLSLLLNIYCHDIRTESILFEDGVTTGLEVAGGVVRRVTSDDAAALEEIKLDSTSHWLLEVDSQVVASGGVLYHYNKPYGDIYMAVAEPFRRRGLGAFIVQELKAVCRTEGTIPAARCNVTNLASRRTLQRAGFVPCGCLVAGTFQVARRSS